VVTGGSAGFISRALSPSWQATGLAMQPKYTVCGVSDNKLVFALVNAVPVHSYKGYESLL